MNKQQRKKIQATRDYFAMSQDEKNEVLRYSIEMRALDERFFIPVDFNNLDAVQKNYIEHNENELRIVKQHEQVHGIKIFKYVTYEQIENIFIKGTLKKEQIEVKPILSNDGYLSPIQFDETADSAAEFRAVALKWAQTADPNLKKARREWYKQNKAGQE
jgi:hypothetical protein